MTERAVGIEVCELSVKAILSAFSTSEVTAVLPFNSKDVAIRAAPASVKVIPVKS